MVTRDMLPQPLLPSSSLPPRSSLPHAQHWDIFCAVIDNFGDIGLCWRLAKQLSTEYLVQVRLWVDDLQTFSSLCPIVNPSLKTQHSHGIEIRHWPTRFPHTTATHDSTASSTDIHIADVVVEAFGCQLPEAYVQAMAKAKIPPYWINLEYLSAEAWVSQCHGLASPHPQWPLTKHFFIPGFDSNSAGLVREKFVTQYTPQTRKNKFWRLIGNPPPPGTQTISLFAYENTALAPLLEAWELHPTPLLCLVPGSRILTSLSNCLKKKLQVGDQIIIGNLELRILPFLAQENYDDLLLSCDINFVRGEDSLVRAIWAGKPFIWHIYPQDKQHHLLKLKAFLERYCAHLPSPAGQALQNFWQAWNHGNMDPQQAWLAYHAHQSTIARHTQQWRQQLMKQEDLVSKLANFCKTPIMPG